jgi:predicted peptidase
VQDAAYVSYVPPGFTGKEQLPMLIFLHGSSGVGTNLKQVEADVIPLLIQDGHIFNAVVLCPQSPVHWTGEQAAAFIDHAMAEFGSQCDVNRIYLTGYAAGGAGVWEGAKLRADLLAAAVPISPTLGSPEGAQALVNLPLWAFHEATDPNHAVRKSRTPVEAVRSAGGQYVFYTEFEGPLGQNPGIEGKAGRMDAWTVVYSNPAMWEWLWRQRRGQPELARNPAPDTEKLMHFGVAIH